MLTEGRIRNYEIARTMNLFDEEEDKNPNETSILNLLLRGAGSYNVIFSVQMRSKFEHIVEESYIITLMLKARLVVERGSAGLVYEEHEVCMKCSLCSASYDKIQNTDLQLPIRTSTAVVISKNFNKGALGTTTPIVWVWPSYNHTHMFKDGNVII